MNAIYLRQSLALDQDLKGEIKGIAYSGGVIKNHFPFQNLIIDLSTLSIAKSKTPLLRDHTQSQVAGIAEVKIDKNVSFSGRVFKKSIYGKEILDLSEEGFEWEMSLGVFDGSIEEFNDEREINGHKLNGGVVLKNGVIREVSIVALGADMNTNLEMFEIKKGEPSLMLTKEQWIKLACACGGSKDSTPEELEQKFAESDEKIKELEDEVAALKEQIAAKEAEIAEIKEAEEVSDREEELNAAVKEKGLEFSQEKIQSAAKSKESTELLLSFIKDMKAVEEKPKKPGQGKISEKFSQKEDLGEPVKKIKGDETEIRLAAEKLVRDGKAENFLEALDMLEVQ